MYCHNIGKYTASNLPQEVKKGNLPPKIIVLLFYYPWYLSYKWVGMGQLSIYLPPTLIPVRGTLMICDHLGYTLNEIILSVLWTSIGLAFLIFLLECARTDIDGSSDNFEGIEYEPVDDLSLDSHSSDTLSDFDVSTNFDIDNTVSFSLVML